MSAHEKIISELHSYVGDIFKEQSLPAEKKFVVSHVFRGSGELSGTWIVAAALTDFALKEGEKIFFDLLGGDSVKGPFYKRLPIAEVTGPVQFTAGDEIMRFVPDSNTKRCLRLKISTNTDLSSAVITAYLVRKR